MTIVTPRTEINTQEKEPNRRVTVTISPGDPRFDEWVSARHDFMVMKGWRDEDDKELDIYDDDLITAQLVTYGENGDLLFGMRLTPINKISNSLSWNMVEDSTIHEQAMEESEKLRDQLWDLTRLVPGPDIPPAERPDVIWKLFYDGLDYCKRQGDDDPIWFFALDKGTNAWLRRKGVEVTELGKARIGNDEVETVFGFVRPAQLADNQFAPSALFKRLSEGEGNDY